MKHCATVSLDCPYCGDREVYNVADLAPTDTLGEYHCHYCDKSYRYVLDNNDGATFYYHVVTLRESEYRAIRD